MVALTTLQQNFNATKCGICWVVNEKIELWVSFESFDQHRKVQVQVDFSDPMLSEWKREFLQQLLATIESEIYPGVRKKSGCPEIKLSKQEFKIPSEYSRI
jgi:hypothetical protein